MTEFKQLAETVFIPEWNTLAQICADGTIYIAFIQGVYCTKDKLRDTVPFLNEEYYSKRERLFDELEEYYKSKYNQQS